MDLIDRTVVVTGASAGVGAATAVALARRGATVWAVGRDRERLDAVAGRNPAIHPLVADLTKDEDRSRLVNAVVGTIDVLVNDASTGRAGTVAGMDPAQVRQMFELNVLGLIDLTQRVLPGMLRRHSGHICNVGSSVAYLPGPPLTVYAATKAAVEGFTDGLRREVGDDGVRVSLIEPGPVHASPVGPRTGHAVSNRTAPEQVARAIVRAIRYDHLPWNATVAVPRRLGLGRLLDLPGIGYGTDRVLRRRTHHHDPRPDEEPDHDGRVVVLSEHDQG